MNKKLFLGMFAAAGMLLATSCSNDELDVVQSGNEAQVSFSLGLEGGIATRAISDGKSADVLTYAVFDKDGKRLTNIPAVSKTKVTFPTTENITLAKGQTYKVAFWAQDEDCKAYTVDTDKMSVSINYANDENKVNNDETRDAFFKTVEFTVTGSTSIDVELKRPFAQINVGVTKEDWDAAVASGITIAQSSVVIKNAATSINLLDGTVGDETVEVSYALANIPSDPAILKVDTDGDGEKEEYNWLSMSYILPADATTGYAKTTLENVAFVFAPSNDTYSNIEFNQGLNSVPVQRNWRTNILGKLLTGDITFNIVIDEEFEDDHNVMVPYATINGVTYPSFADAMAAVQDGETIKLEGETTLEVKDAHLFTIENKSITIDLNGYGFVGKIPDITTHSSIFQVKKGGELTIEGNGNVKVSIGKTGNIISAFVYNNGGTVNLKGGNWTMTTYDSWEDALIPTFVDNSSNVNSATLNIYDGTYTFHRNIFRNHANSSSYVATMNIYGGTFNGRESDEGAIWNQNPANLQVGAGVINVMGGTFNNVEITDDFASVDYLTVTTANELTQVIKDATADVTIFLANDITGNATAEQKEGVNVVVNGNGHKYDGTITLDGNARHTGTETLTLANINFEHTTGSIDFISCNVGGGNDGYAHNVTVKDCTFKGNNNGDVVAMRYRQCYNMSVVSCTATDVHSLMWTTGGENITVDGVNVTAKEGGLSTATTRNITVKNSTITVPTAYGYGIRLNSSDDNTDLNLNFENNTITAEAPILLRQAKSMNYAINLTGTNTLTTSKGYQIIATASDYKSGTELTPATGNVTITGADDFIVYPEDVVVNTVEELTAALNSEKTIYLNSNITVSEPWDSRNTGKSTKPVTIDGQNHTIKLTGTIDDKNWNTVFRFEEKANVMNLTFDLSTAQGNKLKAISAKTNLTVENCTFIGNSTNGRYAIIFGEGLKAGKQDYAATVTGCTFENWTRGITDNQNTSDYKEVTVDGNTFTTADVTLSAYESITFTGNKMVNSAINITSYTSASTAKVKATGNTIDMSLIEYNNIGNLRQQHFFTPENVEAQSGINVITGTNN